MRHAWVASWVLLAACFEPVGPVEPCVGAACPTDGGATSDGGGGGSGGAGGADAGSDAGAQDAGPRDAGASDAGRTDAGLDAGAQDAGRTDAGQPDAGLQDAGLPPADGGALGCQVNPECLGVTAQCDLGSGRCVECLNDTHCFAGAPRCQPGPQRCQGCLSNADCVNPSPYCDPAVLQCSGCAADRQCAPGQACDLATASCVPLPDACGAERTFTFASGSGLASFSVDLGQALDQHGFSCGRDGGAELVYRVVTTAVRDLTVSAAPIAPGTARAAVAIRRTVCASGPDLACDAADAGASSASLRGAAAGEYFFFVEALGGAGRTTVTIAVTAPITAPANDGCSGAQPLTFTGGHAVLVGDTLAATNDTSAQPSSCSATARDAGADLAYLYTLTAPSNVTVTARPLSGSPLRPVVSVRSACATAGTELGCAASVAGEARSVSLLNQAPGTYAVWLDSADSQRGAFQLDVTATPTIANDTCGTALALTWDGGLATATGDTTWANNDNGATAPSPTCSPSAKSTPDVVYSYVLAQAQDVRVAVTPLGAAGSYDPVVYVRRACADEQPSNEVGCMNAAAGQGELALVNQPAGTYFVWVDGALGGVGRFRLDVQRTAPTPSPTNDTCASPQPLSFVQGRAQVSGTTLQAANDNTSLDVSPSCSAGARQNGRDVVYRLDVTATADLTLDVSPVAGSLLRPVLVVRRACAPTIFTDELLCLERAGSATATLPRLAPGTYFVWVDGTAGTSGAFTLTATLGPPTSPPPNDACSSPRALTFVNDVATASQDTTYATNVNDPLGLAPTCGTNRFPQRRGRDLVYSVQLTQRQDLDVRVAAGPGSALRPVVALQLPGACASFSTGDELGCGAAVGGDSALFLPNLPAGTYPLVVDSDSDEVGPYTLTVRRLPATPPPANDACSAPQAVTIGAAPVIGSTLGATDTYQDLVYASACRTAPYTGRDVVYSVTPSASGSYVLTVTPQGGFDPAVLQLGGSCAAASCVRAVDSAGPAGAELVTFSGVAGQPVYFVVDSASSAGAGASGVFTVQARVAP